MPRPERERTAAGFRAQLLDRIRRRAQQDGVRADRIQARVAFERLLARLAGSEDWILKGGFALELRYGWRNRPTKDVDLRTALPVQTALDRLTAAIASADLADQFAFELGEPGAEMQGAPGGTIRVPVVARLAGEVFARFHVDLSSGDALVGVPDLLAGWDFLAFAGVGPIKFPAYPVTQHLAEKLHAYTQPPDRGNTRAKDLADMVAMAAVEAVEGTALLASVQATFAVRHGHSLPVALPEPPRSWAASFTALLARTPALATTDLQDAFTRASRFWNPVLASAADGKRWNPEHQSWIEPA